MVNLDWRVESRAGVSLVELVVENPTETTRRVRIGNRLDGPVWPPRSEGVPEAGWDDGGFEAVLASDERLALGYASPTPSAEPPAEVVWTERAGPSERAPRPDDPAVEATPAGVVRGLGDPRPPADVVPRPDFATDDRSPMPVPVESWLSAVEERAGGPALTADDRAALGAVARRVEALRERVDADARRSA